MKGKKYKLYKNNGITLVALVITIIILLILAGISISSLTGSGLFKKADDATKASDIANVKEQLQIAVMSSRMNSKGSIDKEELRKELENLKKNGIIDSYEEGEENSEIIYTATKGKDVYEINKDGEVNLKGATIVVSGLTVKNGDTVLAENSKAVAIGEPLKVSFKAEIADGTITSVKVKGTEITNKNGAVEYTTDGSIVVTFEIEGKAEDGTIVKREYKVDLKGYYKNPDIKVGDYVNYTPDTPTEAQLTALNTAINTHSGYSAEQTLSQTSGLKWRILELDETGIKPKTLISANTTSESLTLNGANGYNNAVYLINEACETLYSKAGVGEARSITIEDLEDHYSTAGINAKDAYTGEVQYGKTKTYTGSTANYPNIAKEEKNIGIDTEVVDGKNTLNPSGLKLSEQGKNADGSYKTYDGSDKAGTNGMTVTQTYYNFNTISLSSAYENSEYYNLFHQGVSNSYWLASRCVAPISYSGGSICFFFVRFAASNAVLANGLFHSGGYAGSDAYRLRPIVSLESNIEAEYDGAENSTYNTWNIM